jgi:uncharacterized peroxidase-related enzyme
MAKTNTKSKSKAKTNTKSSAKISAKISSKPGVTFAAKMAAAKKLATKPVTLTSIRGGKAAPLKPAGKFTPAKTAPAAIQPDDVPVTALNLPAVKLSPAMSTYFRKCQDKLGFVPNVLLAYAFDNAKLEAFVAMYNELMLGESGLSKLEREMIVVTVSSQNRCYYCLTAHGAAVRQFSGNPLLGEHLVMNYRVARLNKRHRAMLDFAVKLTSQPWGVEEADRERLRRADFTDRDIWDISAVVGFFNMSNRVASATDMRPNAAYHSQLR